MKKSELIFGLLLLPVDYLMLVMAGISAYFVRVGTLVAEYRPIVYNVSFDRYVDFVSIAALAWIIVFAFAGMYAIKSDRRISTELPRTILACTAGVVVIILAIFLQREFFSSRFIIIAAWLFALLYVTIGRIAMLALQRQFLIRGYGRHRVVIIGADKATESMIQAIRRDTKLGYEIIAHLTHVTNESLALILDAHRQSPVDAIIQTDPSLDKEQTLALTDFCDEHHITFKFTPDLFNTKSARVSMGMLAGAPVFEVKVTRLEGWGRIAKRFFDICGALLLIAVTSPVMLLVAIAIKLDSRGPILFSRRDDGSPVQRVGQNAVPFTYFKFRSMYDKSDSMRYSAALAEQNTRSGPLVKIKDDPRITRVGAFIRRFSLDEFPEFFLVLAGKMSLVGPRPHLPEEVARYDRHHKRVLAIKPGITGLAQISGRSDLDFEDEVRLDTYYIENWSIWLDLQILIKTPFIVLFQRRKAL